RAGQQRRDRALPEPPPRDSRVGGRLEHAVHHVLRILLPAGLGDGRRAPAVGPLPEEVPRDSLDRAGLRGGLRHRPPLLPRQDRRGARRARAPDLPRVPDGEAPALRRGAGAPVAGYAGGGRRVRDSAQTLWRDRERRRDARLSPRDLLRRGHARADALGGDRAVGRALSRAAGRDDHLRLRPAQLLRPVQRRGGSPLSPAGDPGALRDGRVTAHRRSAIESTVLTTSTQTSTVTAGWRPGNAARTRISPPSGAK